MRASRSSQRGVTLLFAILIMLMVTVLSVAIINYAGRDRIAAARMSVQERGLACAEAGLQYGRRYFGCNYKTTSGWNAILNGTVPGRYDPALGDAYPASLAAIDRRLRGDRNNDGTLDPGTDLNGDGQADFWVSIRDDDDERDGVADPSAVGADVRTRDNNLTVVLRSECINPAWTVEAGGQRRTVVLETLLVYMPNTNTPYGKATSSSDFPEASATGPTVVSRDAAAMESLAICDETPIGSGI
ncbi:MAG: hypothetical protein HZB56_09455 [Deltaproteobacteria bacterium]|nr:hypothetical protein [Deltaproteobacteria bacterium]